MAKITLTEEVISKLSPAKDQEEFYDSDFSGTGSFGIRINKKGKKTFFLIYRINSKRKRISLGHHPRLSLLAARAEAEQILSQVEIGRDPAGEEKAYKTAETFSDLSTLFVDEYARKRCSSRTLAEYKRILNTELLPYWKDIKAVDIGKSQVSALLDQIADKRGSKIMAKRVRSLISRVFNFSIEKGICTLNPAKQLKLRIEEFPKDRILTQDEIRSLWNALRDEQIVIEATFKALLLTGQKPSSLTSMRWRDIAFDTWHVNDKHEIHIAKHFANLLKKLRSAGLSSEFVFPSSAKRNSAISDIKKATRRLNSRMQSKDTWSAFDLRRSTEYYLHQLGIKLEVVEHILGRKSRLKNIPRLERETDLSVEAAKALDLWGKELMKMVADKPQKPGKKVKKKDEGRVVSLF